jgi:hypothetical protein
MSGYLPSKLAMIAAVAALGIAPPAFAQSYSFPTYAYQHPLEGEASAPLRGKTDARRDSVYNSAVVPTSNSDERSGVGRGDIGR